MRLFVITAGIVIVAGIGVYILSKRDGVPSGRDLLPKPESANENAEREQLQPTIAIENPRQDDRVASKQPSVERSEGNEKKPSFAPFRDEPLNTWIDLPGGNRYMIKEGWAGRRYKRIEIPSDTVEGREGKENYLVKDIIPYEGELYDFTCHPYRDSSDRMGTVNFYGNEPFVGFVKDARTPGEIVQRVFLYEKIWEQLRPTGGWTWDASSTKLLDEIYPGQEMNNLAPFIKERFVNATTNSERNMAMQWILDIGEIDEIIDDVLQLASERNDVSALHVLINAKTPKAVPTLMKFVERKEAHKDQREELQTESAMKALLEVGGKDYITFVVSDLERMKREVTNDERRLWNERQYRDALAQMGHTESINWFIQCLNDPATASWGIIGLGNADSHELIPSISQALKTGYFETDPSSVRTALWTLIEKLDEPDSNELRKILAEYLRVDRGRIRAEHLALGCNQPDKIEEEVDQMWKELISQRIAWMSASDNWMVNGQEMRRAVQHISAWLDGKLPKYRKR